MPGPYERNSDYTDQTGQTISSAQVDSELDELYGAVNELDAAVNASVEFPPGIVCYTAAASPDAGFLFCDGAAVSRATYAALFARIGTTFGAGDGSTTFNVPDIRGRTIVSKGSNSAVDTLGEGDALAENARSPVHVHPMAHNHNYSHTHTATGETGGALVDGSPGGQTYGPEGFAFAHYHGLVALTNSQSSSTTGASSSANTSSGGPSYITLNAQIKT